MKKSIILILSLVLLSGCGKITDKVNTNNSEYINSTSSDTDNNIVSDTLIMLYKECFSESINVNAKMMTFDGKIIDVTDYVYNENGERIENWTENISDILNSVKPDILMPEEEIKVVHDFINSDPFSLENSTKKFGTPEKDSGINYLILLKKKDNGEYSERILCKSGEKNECIDSETVTDFCNWLDKKDYYYFSEK